SLVRVAPDVLEMGKESNLQCPAGFARRQSVNSGLMQRVHHFAKHIELALAVSCVTDTHWSRVLISGQPRQLPFGQAPLAGNSVHDLNLLRAAGDGTQEPLAPVISLLV